MSERVVFLPVVIKDLNRGAKTVYARSIFLEDDDHHHLPVIVQNTDYGTSSVFAGKLVNVPFALFTSRTNPQEPLDYVTPPFPSLYWPLPVYGTQSFYLFNTSDIWRFTLYWTLICYAGMHISTSGYGVITHWRHTGIMWIFPLVSAIIAGIEALVAGSIVGGLLGAIYSSGSFRMSTWIPFVWALINSLILIVASYAVQGGL